jgi:hypothetical protein
MRVVDVVPFLVLSDVKFVVRRAGAKKAKETGVRNVHAFVEGTPATAVIGEPVRITYELFGSSKFVVKQTKEPLDRARFVLLNDEGAFAVV